MLNSKRNRREQNFYCAHELAHYLLHNSGEAGSFQCFDKIRRQQDNFIEWQANEWAAELLLPYKFFIPELCSTLRWPDDMERLPDIRRNIAMVFGVSERVVYHRIESLKYEIRQYQIGVKLSQIEVRSANEQLRRGIHVKSLNEPPKPLWRFARKPINVFCDDK
jgi:Predicted Zn peptidase